VTREANYHEFGELPGNWTRPQWGEKPAKGDAKLLNEADPYKWSGDAAPPAVGTKVKVYMNSFGNGTVMGYFAEYGWLGVMVKISKPPKWWVSQTKAAGENPKNKLGHFFGIDLQPRKMVVSAPEASNL
jgi:hypothetical protein